MNTIENIRRRAFKFVSRDAAIRSAASAVKPHVVMLGDDERFWVVTPADASRLERMGYEWAN